jgi:uncharacterized damage-inducible protein DinB
MFRYNKWANLQFLEACRSLTESQLNAQPPGISGSIGALMAHLVGGQQTFVLRTKGRQHEGELNRNSPWPGFDQLIAIATASSDELIAIAAALDEDSEVVLPWMGKGYVYPRSFFLVHALEHGIEHRTEIKVALNQLGIVTPDLDAWSYSTAAGYGREA